MQMKTGWFGFRLCGVLFGFGFVLFVCFNCSCEVSVANNGFTSL